MVFYARNTEDDLEVETSNINLWIPVITAILGGFVVSIWSFVNLWYSKRKEEALSKEVRNRERLETIYRLLIVVRSEQLDSHQALFGQEDKKGVKLDSDKPMVELDLLTSPYIKGLRNAFKELQEATGEYALYTMKLKCAPQSDDLFLDKELLKHHLNVCSKIESMKVQVSKLSKT